MLVHLGTAMKQYLIVVRRRTLNGHSIVGRSRLRTSIPIPLCALMLLLSACGGEPDFRDSKTLSLILAEAVDMNVLQKRGKENVIYEPNESEPYTGWAKEMYSDGTQVHRLGQYENGERTWVAEWYENGQKAYEGHYETGKETGQWVEWYENGQKAYEGHYTNCEGFQSTYEYRFMFFLWCDRTGQWVGWYENGQKEYEGHYETGKETGQWVRWYENGQKAYEGHYETGKRTGQWVEWDKNGQIRSEKRF